MGRVAADLVRLVRAGLTPEALPEPPPGPSPAEPRRSLLRTLLSGDPFPGDLPVRPRGGRSITRAVFAREVLGEAPERRRPRRNWLAILFAPERLDLPGDAGPEVR
jgi:hypothetical protein